MDLMNIIMLPVAREWLRCRVCQRRRRWRESTGGKLLFYTTTTVLIKAEEHVRGDRRENPISGLRSGESTKRPLAQGGRVSAPYQREGIRTDSDVLNLIEGLVVSE